MRRSVGIALLLSVFGVSTSVATNCRYVPPFSALETQKVRVFIARFYWKFENGSGTEQVEEVCQRTGEISAYDIRGREEEAYHCLKSQEREVFTCASTLNGKPAEISVVPASWIRTWEPADAREYRFHAYILDLQKPEIYQDVFARTLSFSLSKDSIITEGASKNGTGEPRDGFFIRVEFLK